MVKSTIHEVSFYDADCRHCHRSFPVPLLGVSYGELIFIGQRGGVFGYLSAINCPPWDEITDRLLSIVGQKKLKSREGSERLQNVIASCADEIDEQPLGLEFICPYCRSYFIDYGDSRPVGPRKIPEVTFTHFQSLSDSEKNRKLTDLWKR